jgi:hypothetical protein|nr:MAG TPA: hypothetical protein [Myoviridae sp. ctfuG5]
MAILFKDFNTFMKKEFDPEKNSRVISNILYIDRMINPLIPFPVRHDAIKKNQKARNTFLASVFQNLKGLGDLNFMERLFYKTEEEKINRKYYRLITSSKEDVKEVLLFTVAVMAKSIGQALSQDHPDLEKEVLEILEKYTLPICHRITLVENVAFLFKGNDLLLATDDPEAQVATSPIYNYELVMLRVFLSIALGTYDDEILEEFKLTLLTYPHGQRYWDEVFSPLIDKVKQLKNWDKHYEALHPEIFEGDDREVIMDQMRCQLITIRILRAVLLEVKPDFIDTIKYRDNHGIDTTPLLLQKYDRKLSDIIREAETHFPD